MGTFDEGIKAAEWSPDEELLAIVTGGDLLLSLTKSFEPLSEGPLRSTEFGADAPVDVGWGSEGTQFHGSLGKVAAAAAAIAREREETAAEAEMEKDGGEVRISWRGDSAWFAVTSLDKAADGRKKRVIRVFSRIAELSSTSESCPGLQSSLSWQPSGAIIASTQMRQPSGDGKEKGGLYVVFFERNGLRRYDFALREEAGSKVRGLRWNEDSTLLAVWIERAQEDVGEHYLRLSQANIRANIRPPTVQLWHRNNYNWTLKQSISPFSASLLARLNSLFWHPESTLDLYLTTTANAVESFTLTWDTFASSRPAPTDDGAVAVIDGGALRLASLSHERVADSLFRREYPSHSLPSP